MYYNNNNHSSSFRSSQQHATYIDRNNKTLRIQKHLGSGVFGNVYKAYETNTGNEYAIKMTKYNNIEPEKGINEIQILKYLQHYNDIDQKNKEHGNNNNNNNNNNNSSSSSSSNNSSNSNHNSNSSSNNKTNKSTTVGASNNAQVVQQQAAPVVPKRKKDEISAQQQSVPPQQVDNRPNIVRVQQTASQQQSQHTNTFHGSRNYKSNKHNRGNNQHDRNGHRNSNSRGKYSGNGRNTMRSMPNQHNSSMGYLAHNQYIPHQTYNQQPYQQMQFDATAMQQMAMYHQQNMIPQMQVPQANGNLPNNTATATTNNSQHVNPGSNIINNNNNKSKGGLGSSSNNASSQRAGKAPPPGMSNNANVDAQTNNLSNNVGLNNAAQGGLNGNNAPMVPNPAAFQQQGQPQYAPPGMAGYAPNPAYAQAGYFPQQYYGHPGAYYQNTPYSNQRGGYGPPGMAQYNYGSQYGAPGTGQDYNQQSNVQHTGQSSASNSGGQNGSTQMYGGSSTIQSTSGVSPSQQQFIGQYQQSTIVQPNVVSQNNSNAGNIAGNIGNPNAAYHQNGAPQGYTHQRILNHQRPGGQW